MIWDWAMAIMLWLAGYCARCFIESDRRIQRQIEDTQRQIDDLIRRRQAEES